MPEHTTGATDGAETSQPAQDDEASGQPGWAGAMAQIDAEIAELQEMLAKRREQSEEADTERSDDEPDSVA